MAVFNFKISFDSDTQVLTATDLDTNRSRSVSFAPRTRKKASEVQESSEPELSVLERKYELNRAAISFMHLSPGDRLIIAFDGTGHPVIGKQEFFGIKGGNKLSKQFTVVFDGKNREPLVKFGTKFQIEPKDNGIFYLINENVRKKDDIVLDENLQIPASGGIAEIPDINIDDLFKNISLEDESNYVMHGFDFKF